MELGPVGIWTYHLDLVPSTESTEIVRELEELGYGAVWVPEAVGREALTHAGILLAGSSRIVVATGIASIWARDAMAMAGAHLTLSEAYPDRFVLGMGVSHASAVEGLRHHTYAKPYSAMRDYLDAMDASVFMAKSPTTPPIRVLAALGPKMLQLAATRAAGAHPYFVPVEHTAYAREQLGDGPLLCVEQAVVLETDPTAARAAARSHTRMYTDLPNYTNNLRRFGFTDADFPDAGSDRLVDAIVAWGSIDDIVNRVRAHLDAGADHVCVQVIPTTGFTDVPRTEWRELAPALLRG